MAHFNKVADVDEAHQMENMKPSQHSSQESKLTVSSERSKFGIRTQKEKILLVVAGILLILCIVFIALLAKESSSDDDPSSSGRLGKCLLL
jgi:flagellar biosynthesis/type III secretory pathway M-ring protein FliF/YscJ